MVRVSATSTRKVLEWQPTDSDSKRGREKDRERESVRVGGGARVTG